MTDAPLPAVLVVERDPRVARPLVQQLAADGYCVRLALTAEHARVLARGDPPALVLLGEPQHPDTALALLAEIRSGSQSAWPVDLPAIVCGARSQEADLLRAFETGADDFLTQPVNYLELRARLRALLRRAAARSCDGLSVGRLALDSQARIVRLDGRPVQLRHLEYQLLAHLATEPHRVFTKQELLRAVWAHPAPIHTRTLDTHASRLRRKLRAAGDGLWVVNVRGVGYRLI